jgi:UDP:flavonoid glycosyltransferase YjiC (YdhE family)
MSMAPRILFFAPGVSLAHVGRLLTLARAARDAHLEVHFACTSRMARFVDVPGVVVHEVRETMTGADFIARKRAGQPLFSEEVFAADVAEDLRVLDDVTPDWVIGDLRLSLQISARLAGVRYAIVSNAHWSPREPWELYRLPEHPATAWVGVGLVTRFFETFRTTLFELHARPFNRVRARYGMPRLREIREIYVDADHVLFADPPELFPELARSDAETFLGPILWEPRVDLPPWWSELGAHRDRLLVSVGSTGSSAFLSSAVVDAGRDLGLEVMAATSGRVAAPAGARSAPFLPGLEAARRARVVVCNGGSGTMHQAIAAGTPALGICSNMDQFLVTARLAEAGAAQVLRIDEATPSRVRAAIARLTGDPTYAQAARRLGPSFDPRLAPAAFSAWLSRVLAREPISRLASGDA